MSEWHSRAEDWLDEEHRGLVEDENGEPPPIVYNELQIKMLKNVFVDRQRVVSAACGWGSGKSAAIIFIVKFACAMFPGTTHMIVVDTRKRYKDVLHEEILRWCPDWIWREQDAYWTDPESDCKVRVIWYHRPSTRGSEGSSIEGANVTGILIVDECQALPAEVGEKSLGRVRSGPIVCRVFVGLPVPDELSWWTQLSERAGFVPLRYGSSVNRANLAEGWIESTLSDLPEEEYQAMVLGKATARIGAVYNTWSWSRWPDGNLAPEWWRYREDMVGYIAIDPGLRKPSVVIIVEDYDPRFEGRDAGETPSEKPTYIIVGEVNMARVSDRDLVDGILDIAWPRAQRELAPKGGARVWLDHGVIDKAARAKRSESLKSTRKIYSAAVHVNADGSRAGGVGIPLRTVTDPKKTDVEARISRMKVLMCHDGRRRFLCAPAVYTQGRKAGTRRNSWTRMIAEYRYRPGFTNARDLPDKSKGVEDPSDAAGYFVAAFDWNDHHNRRPYAPKRKPAQRRTPTHSATARFRPGGRNR